MGEHEPAPSLGSPASSPYPSVAVASSVGGLGFFAHHGGERTANYPLPPRPDAEASGDAAEIALGDLEYERSAALWAPLTPAVPAGWRGIEWADRPRRFIDGRDIGEIVATLQSPQGYPIPVRLAQIGAAVGFESEGRIRRTQEKIARVVALVGEPFPQPELQELASSLEAHGLRLLQARLPSLKDPRARYDYQIMRKAAENCSNSEMGKMEARLVGDEIALPTLIDGYLDRWLISNHQQAPLIGVIKSHRTNYLSAATMGVLYSLRPGQRTPAFAIATGKFPMVSFYLRLAAGIPDAGVIRVEIPKAFFEEIKQRDFAYLDRLAATLYEYRCRQQSYARAAISLHPIVCVERLLGALFCPVSALMSEFYRIANL